MTSAHADMSDFDRLYLVARYCYQAAESRLALLPSTRQSQAILAEFIAETLSESNIDFAIRKQFVVEDIGLKDKALVDGWMGSPHDLGWLMVHEELSNFFLKFAMKKWALEPYLIHYVPRSVGTNVCKAIHDQSYFVAYPTRNFDVMVHNWGLLGFSRQLLEFETVSKHDRIYAGGHFNLPDMVSLGAPKYNNVPYYV